MSALLQAFLQILLLRASPQVLPCSQLLLLLVLLGHWLVGVALASFTLPVDEALLAAVLGSLLLIGFSWLLLSLFSLTQRILQVVTALAGGEIVIGLLSLPVSAWFYAVEKSDAAVPALLSMVLLGWNLALAAHIYRHAVGASKGIGFLYAIGYMIAAISLASLFGAPEG